MDGRSGGAMLHSPWAPESSGRQAIVRLAWIQHTLGEKSTLRACRRSAEVRAADESVRLASLENEYRGNNDGCDRTTTTGLAQNRLIPIFRYLNR